MKAFALTTVYKLCVRFFSFFLFFQFSFLPTHSTITMSSTPPSRIYDASSAALVDAATQRCVNHNCPCVDFPEGRCDPELEVYDNNTRQLIVLCKWGRSDRDAIRCIGCRQWMCGQAIEGLVEASHGQMCRRCCTHLRDYFVEAFKERSCLVYELFPRERERFATSEFQDPSDELMIECGECRIHHYRNPVDQGIAFPYKSEHVDFCRHSYDDETDAIPGPFLHLTHDVHSDFLQLVRYAREHVPALKRFLSGYYRYFCTTKDVRSLRQLDLGKRLVRNYLPEASDEQATQIARKKITSPYVDLADAITQKYVLQFAKSLHPALAPTTTYSPSSPTTSAE